MSKSKLSASERALQRRSRRRRPAGVSRRNKQVALSFETLEDRRVMSAQSLIDLQTCNYEPTVQVSTAEATPANTANVSYASNTLEGQMATLEAELNRYAEATGDTHNYKVLNFTPTDPLVNDQWYLLNSGQQVGNPDFQDIFGTPGADLNVTPVWNQGITGEGVVVAVIDSGTEFTHPDLAGNIDPNFQYDALTGDTNASPENIDFDFTDAHGTAVAGIIGAVANDIGGVGIAPGVQLVPIRFLGVPFDDQTAVRAFRFGVDDIDITNNSWGPAVIRGLGGPTPAEVLALRDSVIGPDAGRDGLGVIHVFASGNDGQNLDTSSYNGWVNSRYTIAVTGVDHTGQYNNVDGTVTGYPEAGPAVLVAAPTGSNTLSVSLDTGIGSGIVTTDTTGGTGFNQDPDPITGEEPFRDFLESEDYTSNFNGTSAAAPMVSGVIALMLEANPNLSWRDVQEILVRSAKQNSEFDTLANGEDKGSGIEYQSTWIINQVPLFHDPDAWDPLIPNSVQQSTPIIDPLSHTNGDSFGAGFVPENGIHYAPTPQLLTNAAGYTVSQGRGTRQDQIGYGHGVVDADLAVQLALQWSTREQHLANELSFTTQTNPPVGQGLGLPAAEVVEGLIIPGGLGGQAGFGSYWAEYYAPVPDFSPNFPDRGFPQELSVPSPNDMTLENIEVTLSISGGTAAALDNLRMVLVSPNGTHSELNHYFVDPIYAPAPNFHQASDLNLQPNGLNAVSDNTEFLDAGSVGDGGALNFTFSTNRIWGERSDDAIVFNPTTQEPYVTNSGTGGNLFNAVDSSTGDLLSQGWQLHLENYGATPLTVNSIETVWHGSPIGANTKRIQGLIGVDDNRDDLFNFSRVTQNVINLPGDDPSLLRLGEVQNIVDPNHESMAANVTVLAFSDTNSNGIIDDSDLLVDQFVTGADGNYFFDLVPDDYIIALDDDSLDGRTSLDDSLSPAGILKDYQTQWAISSDYFQVWDYNASLEVPIDAATNAPVPFLDGSNLPVEYHVNHINFLLDPGAPAAPEVVFNGQIIADLDGDGILNNNDSVAPGIFVFGDANRNDQFDSGEAFTSTDVDGFYSLTVPSEVTAVIQVGVVAPNGWTVIAPSTEFHEFFTQPGDTISNVDFALQPSNGSVPGSQPGTIFGYVFEDSNEDGVRQASENGISSVDVYIDNNQSGDLDAGDTVVTTNSLGAYVFTDVPVGSHELRADLALNTTLTQTFPSSNFPQFVTVTGSSTTTDVRFGFNNSAILDYGDLPAIYGTIAADGPRHRKGNFFLGQSIDAEISGTPSVDALGDDSNGTDDEDGVIVSALVAGATGQVEVVASRDGGYLQAWIDFNGNGTFDDVIGGVSERIFTDEYLDWDATVNPANPGLNILTFQIPDVIGASTVYARFRYGEFGLGQTGLADLGEVEDYVLEVAPPIVIATVNPDFNRDGDVDGGDFLAWQRGYGIQTNALAGNGDADGSGSVNAADLEHLLQSYGQANLALAAVQSSSNSSYTSVAAMSASLESTFTANFDAASSTAITQQPTQPGFREDVVADPIANDNAASIASEVQRLSFSPAPRAAISVDAEQASQEQVATRVDQGSAIRERAFASHVEASLAVAERRVDETDEENEEDALALAFGEEINWRL